MKIELIMRNGHGIAAMFCGEGDWLALKPEDVEAVKNFGPAEFGSIRLFFDDGKSYLYPAPPPPFTGMEK